MMRFPLRLATALSRTRLAQLTIRNRALFQRLDPSEILHANSERPIDHERLRALLRERRSSILWISGSEPLDHPGIAHLVRALSKSRRFVFFETNGVALRRRIHEFQPLATFFLAVRFDSVHPERFSLALESLRAARLSGFYAVALSPLTSASALADLHALHRSLAQLSIDGWLIYAAAESARPLATQAQSLIPHPRWRKFSQLLERELLAQPWHVPATVSVMPTISPESRKPGAASAVPPLAASDSESLEESTAAS